MRIHQPPPPPPAPPAPAAKPLPTSAEIEERSQELIEKARRDRDRRKKGQTPEKPKSSDDPEHYDILA